MVLIKVKKKLLEGQFRLFAENKIF